MIKHEFTRFFRMEASSGIVLIIATIFAMLMANSSWAGYYTEIMEIPVAVMFGTFHIAKPLLLWVNDGLMAVFFFMIGLEIKREMIEGSLSDRSHIVLPSLAALGGMIVPAIVYTLFNHDSPAAMQGWAIPMATDIAFALGILSLLGPRVPTQLKLFLLALAIIDDLGAIIVIALFYTSSMSMVSLALAFVMIVLLLIMNRMGVTNNTMYVLVGIILWTAVLKSGVHATLAGVILGLIMPIRNNRESFVALENSLHVPVHFIILPLFAFANTGIGLGDIGLDDLTDTMTLGILFGLFFGKQVGVFLFTYIAIKMGLGSLADKVTFRHVYGVAILSGIGFTMSLFIGSLAFECHDGVCYDLVDYRLGILTGSILSGVVGYLYLRRELRRSDDIG